MGIFDLLAKAQEKMNVQAENFANKVEATQKRIEATPTELNQKMVNFLTKKEETLREWKPKPKQSKTAKKIVAMFYKGYPETPYISENRDQKWIQMALAFPKTAPVQKAMMRRYADGLLPGHVYMLYWLKKYTNKKVPVYFEYKYGIDFEAEKIFLLKNGYINEQCKPTEKGEKAIKAHYKVIEAHSPKTDRSIEGMSKQIIQAKKNIRQNGFKEYIYIANKNCCEKCAALNGKHFPLDDFKIGVNAPPMHEGCCCSISAYEDEEAYNKWLNSL